VSKRAKASGGCASIRDENAASGSAGAGPSIRLERWEWLLLGVILTIGAWLRFSHLDLLEFQGDEAYAANLALDCVKHGKFPTAGLMSSVGVTNPPLFIYLLIPMFALSTNPVCVSCCIAVLGLSAVAACWWMGRRYYGSVAGLVAAAFFAVSPWAVIYSRKIWAQDFVPVFATATMWAVHAVCVGKKPKAVFWCVLLPLCVVQIHFSGLALTATVLVIVAWLRPRIDWRFAAGGLVVALGLMIPYLQLQSRTGWGDFKQAMNTVGGGQQWEQLHGITTHPITGYRLPSKQNLSYALAIMNSGRIEDVLGVNAHERIGGEIYKLKGIPYETFFFRKNDAGRNGMTRVVVDAALVLHRLVFVGALMWLAVVAAKRVRGWKVEDDTGRTTWILVLWCVVPLGVFVVAGLWTYLTYFVILYPVHFLACGAVAERTAHRLNPAVTYFVVAILAMANILFLLDYYAFVGNNGGAQGTFGTALGIKQQATQFLAEQGGERLQRESEIQLHLATARTREERENLVRSLGQPMLLELNHEGKPELPQMEWPLLVTQQPVGQGAWPANMTALLVDGNREALQPQQWEQLTQYPSTNFGPIRIFFVNR
jgi:4-amino-4-deoxy-L-arabinose transferase-like glycosyltransferase